MKPRPAPCSNMAPLRQTAHEPAHAPQHHPLPSGAPGETAIILQALERAIRDPSLANRLAAIGAMRRYLSSREGLLDDLDA